MRITKIKVNNFRLLKEFTLDVEKELSLIIGKNNCGKTSLLTILDKFLSEKTTNSRAFTCDDFNIDFQKKLKCIIESEDDLKVPFLGISLKLYIEYEESDNLANISQVMMDLDPANKTIVLAFEYSLQKENLARMKSSFKAYAAEQETKIEGRYTIQGDITEEEKKELEALKVEKKKFIFYDFFKRYHQEYFRIYKKTVAYNLATSAENDDEFHELDNTFRLDKILNIKIISARRDVSNKDNDKTLSVLSSKYYEKRESLGNESAEIKQFKDTLSETDSHLDEVYKGLFKEIISKVGKFGGVKDGDSIIKIVSTLQHRELLKGNTTVMYDHNAEHSLPENYNGLGYMNLIGMIFEIEVLLTDFRKENKENEKPADINLLFIEEPEAHTHPQMQYVFIKNIKDILFSASKGNGEKTPSFNLQTIITTHSSHITAESEFDDIKYFSKKNKNQITAKNLKDLQKAYESDGQTESYKFLKQYLTLNRAELFFADKAIFIEGDTERILLPAMMKKIDQEIPDNPLLSQNISIVEVGAYSHIFEKFIDFVGVKSLIISDIDGAKAVTKIGKDGNPKNSWDKCIMTEATDTTNASLMYFHNNNKAINYYKGLTLDLKVLKKNSNLNRWEVDNEGKLLMVYQLDETNNTGETYHARSFEDAFFHLNSNLLETPEYPFTSLTKKYVKKFKANHINVYDFVNKAVGSKPTLAMEILLNSKEDTEGKKYSNWQIPAYIKEGLLWLKKD
ncbi:ATP-dependent nuclease [Adhaeribacter soli]|uniref:AAA family ATPase n=1 Tax=Adhaeribacter soli TaxID=2607655 RepID=A0A5N1IZB3_9BACT|nr:ATP-dependent endonuclease [Adhaeribacter soli]KAA9338796.1 AAA family ATPase [Adhaeribacter soli]